MLLPGHILYKKPGGHKIQGLNSKVPSMLSKTIPTDSACYNDSEKSIV